MVTHTYYPTYTVYTTELAIIYYTTVKCYAYSPIQTPGNTHNTTNKEPEIFASSVGVKIFACKYFYVVIFRSHVAASCPIYSTKVMSRLSFRDILKYISLKCGTYSYCDMFREVEPLK